MDKDKVVGGDTELDDSCFKHLSSMEDKIDKKVRRNIDDTIRIVDTKIDGIKDDIRDLRDYMEKINDNLDVKFDILDQRHRDDLEKVYDKHNSDIEKVREEMGSRDKRMVIFVFTIISVLLALVEHIKNIR